MRPLTEPDYDDWDDEALPVIAAPRHLRLWARVGLIVITLGILLVFGVAVYLDPYRDGRVWEMETHTQLGLPPCTFKEVTGIPCPSCGMSTSFALLVRGDVWDSLEANYAGTLLAVLCLLYVPWAVVSVWRGKLLWVVAPEDVFVRLLILFFTVMLARWVLLLIVRAMFPS